MAKTRNACFSARRSRRKSVRFRFLIIVRRNGCASGHYSCALAHLYKLKHSTRFFTMYLQNWNALMYIDTARLLQQLTVMNQTILDAQRALRTWNGLAPSTRPSISYLHLHIERACFSAQRSALFIFFNLSFLLLLLLLFVYSELKIYRNGKRR